MSTPASEVFGLRIVKRPLRKRVLPWIGFWIGALMAMGDPGTGAPASEEILVIRLSDGETVSHYTEGFNKPAMYDELAGDLAAMTAEEFEAEWVH